MKAIVLAGGFATRLRPLSCTRQKLLFPVGNKPLLDWTIEQLARFGVSEAILAVNYLADELIHHYVDVEPRVKLSYSIEQKPLGTGGAIKNAERLVASQEAFLVLNGDILTDFNYAALLKQHTQSNATATVALHHSENPSRYGVVDLDEDNRIIKFVEKPLTEAVSDRLINAGIYALSPRIFDYIPSGQPFSIERDIFPKLITKEEIFGYPFEDLWIDIGKPRDYLKANRLFMNIKAERNKLVKSSFAGQKVRIKHPAAVDTAVTVGAGSRIGPYAAIGTQTRVGKNVTIENSVILSQALILDSTVIKGAIVGEGVAVGNNVVIGEDCIIGDRAVIQDNVTLAQGVIVCPFRKVTDSVAAPKCLM